MLTTVSLGRGGADLGGELRLNRGWVDGFWAVFSRDTAFFRGDFGVISATAGGSDYWAWLLRTDCDV